MDPVLERINEKLGNDLDMKALLKFKQELNLEEDLLKHKLYDDDGEISLRVSGLLSGIEQQKSSLNTLLEDLDQLQNDLDKHDEKVQRVQNITSDYISKIGSLEKTQSYLATLKHIESISSSIEEGLNERGNQRAVNQYSLLRSLAESLKSSSCSNLNKHVSDIVMYWHSVLKDQFSKEYEEILKSLKWPFLAANVPPVPSPELLNRLHALTEVLIQIQLPENLLESSSTSDASRQLSLPILLLVRPLKKRFIYHFSGARQTNQADKPEWYFTQILNWLKEHLEFVEKHLQMVYDRVDSRRTSVRMEFTLGLVQLAMEKLHHDLPHLQYDDALFSHTVDEALGFTTELYEGYGYPTSEPGVLSVLTQAHFFVKWIHLEKKYSLEKLDAIMRSESAFHKCLVVDDEDFTTECVDKFLTLMSTITERYKNLSQPGHRLQFLQLQLDLLDDFRVRLLQLLRAQEDITSIKSYSAMILNSISCLIFVLQEWGSTPHFLELQYYQQQLEDKGEGGEKDIGVFEDVISLFLTMENDLLDNITNSLATEAKAPSLPYRTDRWHAMDEPEEGVTHSSIGMFNALTLGLCNLHDALTPRLRTQALRRVARTLDTFLFEELVMQVHFSTNGAKRFCMDVRKGFLPLFGQYMATPQAHFPLLSDTCSLLSLPQGSALLLKSALSDPRTDDFLVGDAILDVGVTSLGVRDVLKVLGRRTDL